MTRLETIAVELHDHMWSNMGVNDDWPLQVCGDDEEVTRLIELLNNLREEITAQGYNRIEYCRRLP